MLSPNLKDFPALRETFPVIEDIRKRIKELITPEKIEQIKHVYRGLIHGKEYGL